ncbi:hypothetical protein AMATHDRAFT_84732 [Amanita thiersii Skay4041]|uniref:BTB domain-containing protein n=1 Tax=Amanita thiersii Skay4041 TaxID=703135 RepID=A0A2A9NWR8_9AGAR|nr:hypothetical protein AMATHDRAFT_84732 [Amanita thiersii Skay4041]
MAYPNANKHERFYFPDGTLSLVVEDRLYRLHQYLFIKHSSRFPGIMESPAPTKSPFGWYDTPTVLKDIKRVDFDRLLAYLYPEDLTVEGAKSTEDWSSILNLASRWGFKSLRERAISKLGAISSPIEKVVLGRGNNVLELLRPGYINLCQSTVPLSYEEGARLGMEDVIKIYRVRQEIWGGECSPDVQTVTNKVQRYWFQSDSKSQPDRSDQDSNAKVIPADIPPTPPSPNRPKSDSDEYIIPSLDELEKRPEVAIEPDVYPPSEHNSLQPRNSLVHEKSSSQHDVPFSPLFSVPAVAPTSPSTSVSGKKVLTGIKGKKKKKLTASVAKPPVEPTPSAPVAHDITMVW